MKFCLRVFCWLVLYITYIQGQNKFTETLSIENGLSQGMIFDLLQTSDGFLWIATKHGLNRYDGYNFKIFTHNPLHPYSIAENTATALFEDSRGWLWVGTENNGIDLYNPLLEQFYHIPIKSTLQTNGSTFEVAKIVEAPDGAIWFYQPNNNVFKISIPDAWKKELPKQPNLGALVQITHYKAEQFVKAEANKIVTIFDLVVQPNGEMWALSSRRAYLLLPGNEGAISPIDPKQVANLTSNRFYWGSVATGLCFYQNGKPVAPVLPATLVLEKSLIKHTTDNSGYWLAINNKLWLIKHNELPDFSKPDWETDALISAITTDRNNNIWIGTRGYGLRKINPRRQLFHAGAEGNSIWGLWRDAQNNYYCKVINALYAYNPQTGKLHNQRAFGGIPKRVLDMCIDPTSGNYWLLGRGDDNNTAEIRQYNPHTGESVGYPFPFDSLLNASGSKTWAQWFLPFPHARIYQAPNNNLWVVGLNCRLIRFVPQTAHFEQFSYASVFGDKATSVQPYALTQDGNGNLWIGTQQGLVKCTQKQNSFTFERIPSGIGSLNNNAIACLLPHPANPKQGLWIGTKGGGINFLDFISGKVHYITTQEGLPDDVVYGILPGKENELWCSTNRGLAKLAITQKAQVQSIASFTASQGLQDNEFNTNAFFRANDGELLFGGVNGLNRFYPDDVLPDTLPPPMYLVGLHINHRPVSLNSPQSPLTKPLAFLNQLYLTYTQNNLSFEFATLDFTDPAKNRYRYRLVGADHDWVEAGTNRFAQFTHLHPGRYTLLAQGNNGEGNWQSIAQPIQIIIAPPWWFSTPMYMVYALSALTAVWQTYRFQIRRYKLREQLAFEQRETERVKALEQMKTNFFSNVTHEFRTPLTLMQEPLRQLLINPNDPNLTEKIRLAEKNSRQLLVLVNQLLDMAKLESGSMTLDLRNADFTQTTYSIFEQFLPLAHKQQIQLSFDAAPNIPPFYFDPAKLELILNNLLSNAIKFTPPNGKIILACQLVTDAHRQPCVQVSVNDNGIGIDNKALNRVFDRFYQVNNPANPTHVGTGIGLALTKELVELMGGNITVTSKLQQGSQFVFTLPIVQNAPAITMPPNSLNTGNEFTHAAIENIEISFKTTDANTNGELPLALVIEDNPELRSFIKHSIGAGWQVTEAANGEEGIQKALELLPDIIVSDLMMPHKDGFAVCTELKNNELTAHVPIILLTAKTAVESKIQGLRTGADDYLTKPFNTDELVARMTNLVEQRRRLRLKFAQETQVTALALPDALPDTAALPSEPDREFLRRFTQLVEQNLNNNSLTVEELAKLLFISRVQLHRKLKALTDQSVTDFLRNYRLERAMSMLRNKEGLVYQIAESVGFGNEKYFSRAFKEKYGISPGQVQ